MPATDVGDAPALAQFCFDSIEGGNPTAD